MYKADERPHVLGKCANYRERVPIGCLKENWDSTGTGKEMLARWVPGDFNCPLHRQEKVFGNDRFFLGRCDSCCKRRRRPLRKKVLKSAGPKQPLGPSGMSPMNPRMNPPRGQPMGPMNPGNYGGMRPPGGAMGPSGPQMSPMSMPGPGGRPWNPNTSSMNYSSSSPGSHYGGPPVSSSGGQGPGTPIMPSPQGSGPDGMYTMMKPVPGGNMPGFPMGPGPDGPMGPMGPDMGPPVLNGISSADGMEGMKNSPATGPGTPREDGPQIGDYGIPNYGQDNLQRVIFEPGRS
ncbi:single-stranded DNA-binding protein 3 [Nephila pilipes]|uniref:Single-stranded DNA-binding protein 3 n=2 Tax=Nephilidae TaxID=450948 RepID=A0A8X6QZX1_NEPPI|nr:single-stranded DNA-binding protein 3 [Nephila pilipes]